MTIGEFIAVIAAIILTITVRKFWIAVLLLIPTLLVASVAVGLSIGHPMDIRQIKELFSIKEMLLPVLIFFVTWLMKLCLKLFLNKSNLS